MGQTLVLNFSLFKGIFINNSQFVDEKNTLTAQIAKNTQKSGGLEDLKHIIL